MNFHNSSSFPEYRWGNYLGRDEHFLKINAPVIGGNSGSPVLMRNSEGGYKFIGIVSRKEKNRDICYAIPASFIRKYFKGFFEYIKNN